MKVRLLTFWILSAMLSMVLQAQKSTENEYCGFDYLKRQKPEIKDYSSIEKKYRLQYRQAIRNFHSKTSNSSNVYKIPSLIHIIHSDAEIGSAQNPSEQQILELINAVNQNFRHSYQHATSYFNPFYGTDTQIELHLIQRDLQGYDFNGIRRYNLPEMAHNANFYELTEFIGEEVIQEPRRVCNLVIVSSMIYCGVSMGSDLYTLYSSLCLSPELINHEIGHYLNLLHTFQFQEDCTNNDCLVDNDKVCDTPPSYSQSPCQETNSCSSDEDDTSGMNPYRPVQLGGMGDQSDMNINYMSYADYECQETFTWGQKVRMHSYIQEELSTLMSQEQLIQGLPAYQKIHAIKSYESDDGSNLVRSMEIPICGNFPAEYIPGKPIDLCVETRGLHTNANEAFQVLGEDGQILGNTGFSFGQDSCKLISEVCFDISPDLYSEWVLDDTIKISFIPIDEISIVDCSKLPWMNSLVASVQIWTYPCGEYEIEITGMIRDQSYFISSGHILSDAVISDMQNIVFRAPETIQLLPGFHVSPQSTFEAVIGPCTSE